MVQSMYITYRLTIAAIPQHAAKTTIIIHFISTTNDVKRESIQHQLFFININLINQLKIQQYDYHKRS
jgi:hypothetical protein